MNWVCIKTDEAIMFTFVNMVKGKIKKDILVTGREDAHFLENQLTDDGEVLGLTSRPPFIPRKIPGTHF
jgi:hypothetical protein